jgi:integrase
MAAVISRLRRPQPGLTKKNRSRLRPFDDSGNALALVRMPEKLMSLADRERRPQRAALSAEMAVVIEILLMAPIRIGNLAALDIERHLVRPGRVDGGLHIVIEGDEVKNDEPLEFPLPPGSVRLIEHYLDKHRPALAPFTNTALFPTARGTKSDATLREQIIAVVHRHTGLRVNPHLFRHIAAKLYLDAHPGGYELIRRLLGHVSIETTIAFYTGLETAAAVRHFDATILKLREEGA